MRLPYLFIYTMIYSQILLMNCAQKESGKVEELKFYSADNLENIINLSRVKIDSSVFSEGSGSIRIDSNKPMAVKLYETGSLDVDNCRIIYQAKLKTENFRGDVYLEMWCHFPGKGDFFSRALQTKLSGDNNWSFHETPFLLQKGEKPDNVKLNVVVNGTGRVWVDEIKLIKVPLQLLN